MAAPTIRQHKANQSSTGTSVTVTLTSSVLAGNMLLIFVSSNISSTINTPTMTGETFTKITAASVKPSAAGQISVYATFNAAGGQTVVTATMTGCSGCGIHCHVFEISGQAASPVDATGTLGASTTWSVSTTGSTTNATDLVISYWYDDDGEASGGVTAGGSYVKQDETDCFSGNSGCGTALSTTSGTGVQTTTTANWPFTSDRLSASIIALAPPAATGIRIPYVVNPGNRFGMGF